MSVTKNQKLLQDDKMTRINQKGVTRITDACVFEVGKYRKVAVTIEPKTLTFRLKGTSRKYSLPITTCFMQAVIAHVEDVKNGKRRRKQ